MNGIVQLFKYFGILSAFVIAVGFYSKSEGSLLARTDSEYITDESPGPTSEYATMSLDKARAALRENDYRRPVAVAGGDRDVVNIKHESGDQVRGRRDARATISRRDLNRWLELNAAQTYLEAEKETIAPGVILATGIYFLQQGETMNLTPTDIATYLVEVRDNASSKAKKHMKYIANSEEWFKGLSAAGFDGQRIADIYQRHDLRVFDKAMYNRHVEKKIEQPDYQRDTETLEGDVEVRRANLAAAYNDYAERPEVRKKYNLPSAPKMAAAATAEEVSAGRREAETFRQGESKVYDDPRFFWAVLQEVIALEEGFSSWDAYQAKHPSAAERKFQRRSDIMALGGEMKVTRR